MHLVRFDFVEGDAQKPATKFVGYAGAKHSFAPTCNASPLKSFWTEAFNIFSHRSLSSCVPRRSLPPLPRSITRPTRILPFSLLASPLPCKASEICKLASAFARGKSRLPSRPTVFRGFFFDLQRAMRIQLCSQHCQRAVPASCSSELCSWESRRSRMRKRKRPRASRPQRRRSLGCFQRSGPYFRPAHHSKQVKKRNRS